MINEGYGPQILKIYICPESLQEWVVMLSLGEHSTRYRGKICLRGELQQVVPLVVFLDQCSTWYEKHNNLFAEATPYRTHLQMFSMDAPGMD